MNKRQLDAIYAHKCKKCGGVLHPSASGGIDLDKLLQKAIKNVYKERADEMQQKLGDAFAANIGEAVSKGYKDKLFSVDWESPDAEMIRHLQSNVYHFSIAKSHQQLKALTQALYDEDGKIVPFTEFKDIASRINNEMAVAHLKTEYDTAIGSAQMASRWVEYQKDADVFPNLTYQTAGDSRVRPSHDRLDGITRPIDDPFWDSYYPPNGWNCRCDVIQATGGRKITPGDKIVHPEDVPPMFKTNTAKQGVVFPKDHPYFDHLPDEVQQAATEQNPFSYKKSHKGKKGGYTYDSALSNAGPHELSIADTLADNGDKVIMLPEVPSDTDAQKTLRDLCLPKDVAATRRNPDCRIGTKIVELKRSTTNSYSSITRALKLGSRQADIVCLKLTAELELATLKRIIKGRLMAGTRLKEVWVIFSDDKVQKWTAEQILSF